MTDNKLDVPQGCDYCGQAITGKPHNYSVDLQVSTTMYEDGEIIGTQEAAPPEIKHDYIIICPDCVVIVVDAWNEMVLKVVSRAAAQEADK